RGEFILAKRAMNRHLHFHLTQLIVAAAGALLLAGGEEKHDVSSAEQLLKVRVQKPEVKPVTDYEKFTGRVQAPDSLSLRRKVPEYLLRWNFEKGNDTSTTKDYNFVSGQEVKRDQVLFKIDPRPYQAVYDQSQAQIALAKARLELAIADYKRAQNIARTPGAISQQDVDKYL